MEIMKKLFYRKFSKDEYRQLRTIYSEETKVMRKRPGYIIGLILFAGLLFYFLVRAFGPENLKEFRIPKIVDVFGIVFGTAVGICVVWLLLKLFKAKSNDLKFFVVFWGFWMVAFSLLTIGQGNRILWEFVAYAALLILGCGFWTGSIEGHFCEKIFMSQKEKKRASDT